MRERITRLVVKSGLSEGYEFSARGYTSNPLVRHQEDATITKATGLEAPTMDITGGPVSYGGSFYTGISLNDREVVLTVKPRNISAHEIKRKLNTLISRSAYAPLMLDIHTEVGKDASKLSAECYITNVTSPIFEKDNVLQITVRCPRPYFEREARSGLDGLNITKTSEYSSGGNRYVHYRMTPAEPLESHEMTAPSALDFRLTVDQALKTQLNHIALVDPVGSEVRVSFPFNAWSASGISNGTMTYDYTSRYKTIKVTPSPNHDESDLTYIKSISPGWVMVHPGLSEISLIVSMQSGVVVEPISQMEVTRFNVYSRTLGL